MPPILYPEREPAQFLHKKLASSLPVHVGPVRPGACEANALSPQRLNLCLHLLAAGRPGGSAWLMPDPVCPIQDCTVRRPESG